jgi:phosphoribosylanthranilate isomerase
MIPARTRVKICGIREAAHARIAAEAGADAIGLVFHPPSPRHVTPQQASRVVAALPPFVSAVGLFVDQDEAQVRGILDNVALDVLQFHGDQPPGFCELFGRPYIRAVPVGPGTDLIEWAGRFKSAKALLLDAHVAGERGGTGRGFDWTLIPRELPIPIILSGGLDVENVARAVREVRPWAVDVSSGVETGRGSKDPAKIVEFVRSVQREDAGSSR